MNLDDINKKKFVVTTIIITMLVILLGSVVITVHASEYTVVSIDPPIQAVSPGDAFDVDVYCIPDQPIKSFEFKISFDPSLLQANSVNEGDIFDGYTILFNDGTINNVAGTIVDIYDFVIGPGGVSDSGVLVTISFTAKSTSGTSDI